MDEALLEIKLRGNGKNGLDDVIFSNMNDMQDAISSVIMARSVPAGSSNVGSSHLLTVSCKLRAGNGQELIGYFLCNSGRNPAARNLPVLAGIGENCAGIEKSCTGIGSDFNGSSRRNDRPG
ncbi:unnamed protein product [Adineta ricciae]|nr:unnamed protein product [Adineta ricciae]